MDTRFWGPSGWRLLHLIAFSADTLPLARVRTFFETLPYVLPCKFCRASLTDYIAVDPIPAHADAYAEWLYRIHNRVNAKLRDQKLLETADPAWKDVKRQYMATLRAPCTRKQMIGWDFLFSVAYTTPCASVPTSPMPDAPPLTQLTTPDLRNRWGVISRDERLKYMRVWWQTLADALPFESWRRAWKRATVLHRLPLEKGRQATTRWLYAVEKAVCAELSAADPIPSYTGLCNELSAFSSGCGKTRNLRVKTCRAQKSNARKTLRVRRRTTYKASGGFL
jgi:hypothetical protein